MKSEKISKAPPMCLCARCNQWRQRHQRYDPDTGKERELCINCYLHEHPPERKKDFCARCSEYGPIVGRGLCQRCYDKLRRNDDLDLEDYPTKR